MGDSVLVIGSGGREHALTWKLAQSPLISEIKVAPGNAGTSSISRASNISLNVKDHNAVVKYCLDNNVKLVVVGPEDPLANGLANDLTKMGICCFGPNKNGALIEASKEFSKDFMDKYNIPTAKWKSFQDAAQAKEYIEKADFDALVVKASGLAAGKGVVVAADKKEAIEAAEMILKDKKFGDAGDTIVVEELLKGEEISVLAFTDGITVAVMPPAQDHKRAFDGDKGPNTGGMGAYCPCPLVTDDVYDEIKENIMQRTLDGLVSEKIHYVGVLYAGLMLTKDGPKVLEFNCRFGDPETESILPLLKSDLYPILLACTKADLNACRPVWKEGLNAVNVVMVSGGYPDAYPKGKIISGLESFTNEPDLIAFHAGTAQQGKDVVTSGGRVIVVVGLAKTLKDALDRAMEGVARIKFEGCYFRRDIAHKALRHLASTSAGQITYKSSGVDIEAGELLVSKIKSLAASTKRCGMASSLGGFGGVFDLKDCGYTDPLLVSGTDGVGTKLKVAQLCNKHDTVGIDLVAMCVNDILTQGAEPLFFLDYFGCGKLHVDVCRDVVAGVAEGCRQSTAALVGGETAEMPGMYPPGEYDLAGFAVGAVERNKLLPDLNSIKEGDDLIGIPSSGVHSNGFSLLRKIAAKEGLNFTDKAPFDPSKTLGDVLLIPTKIYIKSMLSILQMGLVKAAAHITGGGILDNIPRVLPKGFGAVLDANKWDLPPVFQWIADSGNVSSEEMLRSFNCGLGMVLIVQKNNTKQVLKMLEERGESPSIVGQVVKASADENLVSVRNFKVAQKPVTQKPRKKVGVLISGSGTNLQSLINYTQDPTKNSAAEIVLVISNVASAGGLQKAQKANIPTMVFSHKNYKSRVEFDMAVHKALLDAGVEIVCLAGFMRIVSEEFVRLWHGALLNIHPSLLPSFRGIHAHRQVLEARVRVTGCTVHFVEPDVDTGGIILQEAVPVLPNDTEETLAERVKVIEHKIFPESLELLASGTIKLNSEGKVEYLD